MSSPTSVNLIKGAVKALLTKTATVQNIDQIEERFMHIELQGDPLRNCDWTAGQKLQAMIARSTARTYTPMNWDAERGTVELLIHLHSGGGPGNAWARSLALGQPCTLFGPRKSTHVPPQRGSLLIFGDETSLALIHGYRRTWDGPGSAVAAVLEVRDVEAVRRVVERLALPEVVLVERLPNEGHGMALNAELSRALTHMSPSAYVLSGRAAGIQQARRALRERGVASRQLMTRAYWAQGKAGLD